MAKSKESEADVLPPSSPPPISQPAASPPPIPSGSAQPEKFNLDYINPTAGHDFQIPNKKFPLSAPYATSNTRVAPAPIMAGATALNLKAPQRIVRAGRFDDVHYMAEYDQPDGRHLQVLTGSPNQKIVEEHLWINQDQYNTRNPDWPMKYVSIKKIDRVGEVDEAVARIKGEHLQADGAGLEEQYPSNPNLGLHFSPFNPPDGAEHNNPEALVSGAAGVISSR